MADADRQEDSFTTDPDITLVSDQDLLDQNPELCKWLEPLVEADDEEDFDMQLQAFQDLHALKLATIQQVQLEQNAKYVCCVPIL